MDENLPFSSDDEVPISEELISREVDDLKDKQRKERAVRGVRRQLDVEKTQRESAPKVYIGDPCPKCGRNDHGEIRLRTNRTSGSTFSGCSRYHQGCGWNSGTTPVKRSPDYVEPGSQMMVKEEILKLQQECRNMGSRIEKLLKYM